jgi:hypothetical protein
MSALRGGAEVAQTCCHVAVWPIATFRCAAEFGRYREHSGHRASQARLIRALYVRRWGLTGSALRTLKTTLMTHLGHGGFDGHRAP